jgi:hypothetical protein
MEATARPLLLGLLHQARRHCREGAPEATELVFELCERARVEQRVAQECANDFNEVRELALRKRRLLGNDKNRQQVTDM